MIRWILGFDGIHLPWPRPPGPCRSLELHSCSSLYEVRRVLTALQLQLARLLVHGILGQIHVASHCGGDPK